MMKNEITTQITTAYQTILARKGRRHGDWITLTDLRIELDETFPRYEIDEALREMYRTQQAILIPESNQKILTEWRSEEHTSELQSRENLVCRLLLEKKKKNESTDQSRK